MYIIRRGRAIKEIFICSMDPDLTKLAHKVGKELNLDFALHEINAYTHTKTLPITLDDNVKVIVSRGGAARLIREQFDMPVVEIGITFTDIMRCISDVVARGGKRIAFVTSTKIVSGNESFKDINGLDVTIRSFDSYSSYNDRQRVEKDVLGLVESGEIDAIIRDALNIPALESMNVIVSVLKSNEDSVRKALLEAGRVLEAVKNEENKRKELEIILQQIGKGIITLDRQLRVKKYNDLAGKLLGVDPDQLQGSLVDDFLPIRTIDELRSKGEAVIDDGDRRIVITAIPIIEGDRLESSIIILDRVENIVNQELAIRTSIYEKQGLVARYGFEDIYGSSEAIGSLKKVAHRYAASDEVVLITGETGTGKELFAHSIHRASRRCRGPFVSVNCAAFNEALLESELFGYEEGSFTGALKGGKKGLLEIAHKGTLFLDEVSKTSLSFQAALLRVLQEKTIRRIGATSYIPIDCRIICATNKDLRREVSKGMFLEDMFYRIGVLKIDIPPLRERKADIADLARRFAAIAYEGRKPAPGWDDEGIIASLTRYSWPGNARQLQNFIKRVAISSGRESVTRSLVEAYLLQEFPHRAEETLTIPVGQSLAEMERQMFQQLYKLYNGDKELFCRRFGISRTTLWRKISDTKTKDD